MCQPQLKMPGIEKKKKPRKQPFEELLLERRAGEKWGGAKHKVYNTSEKGKLKPSDSIV